MLIVWKFYGEVDEYNAKSKSQDLYTFREHLNIYLASVTLMDGYISRTRWH